MIFRESIMINGSVSKYKHITLDLLNDPHTNKKHDNTMPFICNLFVYNVNITSSSVFLYVHKLKNVFINSI